MRITIASIIIGATNLFILIIFMLCDIKCHYAAKRHFCASRLSAKLTFQLFLSLNRPLAAFWNRERAARLVAPANHTYTKTRTSAYFASLHNSLASLAFRHYSQLFSGFEYVVNLVSQLYSSFISITCIFLARFGKFFCYFCSWRSVLWTNT